MVRIALSVAVGCVLAACVLGCGKEEAAESKTKKYHEEAAMRLLLKKDKKGAIAAYTKAIKADPKDAVAYANRGALQGDNKRALADLNKAIELDPKYANAYSNRAKVRKDMGDAAGAKADAAKAEELGSKK